MSWHPNPNLNAAIQRAVREGVNAYMLVFSRALRVQLSKPGTGRRYRVSQGKGKPRNARESGWHIASRPGSPPAVDTGMLRRSWQIGNNQLVGQAGGITAGFSALLSGARRRILGRSRAESVVTPIRQPRMIGYRFGSAVKYATIEYGSGRAAARPYLRPTMEAVNDLFEPTMAAALARHFPPAGGASGGMRRV